MECFLWISLSFAQFLSISPKPIATEVFSNFYLTHVFLNTIQTTRQQTVSETVLLQFV